MKEQFQDSSIVQIQNVSEPPQIKKESQVEIIKVQNNQITEITTKTLGQRNSLLKSNTESAQLKLIEENSDFSSNSNDNLITSGAI